MSTSLTPYHKAKLASSGAFLLRVLFNEIPSLVVKVLFPQRLEVGVGEKLRLITSFCLKQVNHFNH